LPGKRNCAGVVGLVICAVVAAWSGSVPVEGAPPSTRPAAPLNAQQLFAQASPAVVKIEVYSETGTATSTGSGFFIDASGTIVTNHHVIDGASSVRVHIQKRPSLLVVKIIAADKKVDLAILKVEGKNFPFLQLRTNLPKVGEKVYAIGSPAGLTNTLSDGLVSGLRRDGGMTRIQTSAPIAHGSSGGPLLSSDGKVLGVTTSGFSGEGDLGFAVPSQTVAHVIKHGRAPTENVPKPKSKTVKRPTTQPVRPDFTSIEHVFADVPRDILPKRPNLHGQRKWTELQIGLLNKWLGTKTRQPGQVLSVPVAWGGSDRLDGTWIDGSTVIARFAQDFRGPEGLKFRAIITTDFNIEDGQKLATMRRGQRFRIKGTIHRCDVYAGQDMQLPLDATKSTIVRLGSSEVPALRIRLKECSVDSGTKARRNPPQRPRPTTRPAPRKRTDEEMARSQLKLAKSYIDARVRAKAVKVLKQLIAKYPKTWAAREARAKLEELLKE